MYNTDPFSNPLQIVKYGPTEVYVAEPASSSKSTKALLLLSDVFGLGLVNTKLLADDFARAGYHVYAPDLFRGEPLTDSLMADPKVGPTVERNDRDC